MKALFLSGGSSALTSGLQYFTIKSKERKGLNDDKTACVLWQSFSSIMRNTLRFATIQRESTSQSPQNTPHTCCLFSRPSLKLSRQVRHKSILITPLCHSRCVLGAGCKNTFRKSCRSHTYICCLLLFPLSLISAQFIATSETFLGFFKRSPQEVRLLFRRCFQ